MLALALEDEGYDVTTARNGREALELIVERPFAVALVDLQMPVMDGFTLCQILREHGIHLPVVFMSAGGRAHLAAETLRVEGYLEKPFTLDDLYGMVARFGAARTTPPGRVPEQCPGTNAQGDG